MSNKVNGTINWVGSKDIRGRKYWSFRVEGNDAWFRTGDKQPPVSKGDSVSFIYEETQYGNQVAVDSIKVTESRQATATSSSGGSSSGKDDYWNRKEVEDQFRQKMIQFNHCTNAAVEVAQLALTSGVLNLGAGNKAGKLDALLAHISTIRNALYDEADAFSVALAAHRDKTGNLNMSVKAQTDETSINDADFEDDI